VLGLSPTRRFVRRELGPRGCSTNVRRGQARRAGLLRWRRSATRLRWHRAFGSGTAVGGEPDLLDTQRSKTVQHGKLDVLRGGLVQGMHIARGHVSQAGLAGVPDSPSPHSDPDPVPLVDHLLQGSPSFKLGRQPRGGGQRKVCKGGDLAQGQRGMSTSNAPRTARTRLVTLAPAGSTRLAMVLPIVSRAERLRTSRENASLEVFH